MINPYMKLIEEVNSSAIYAEFVYAKGRATHNGVPELMIYSRHDKRPYMKVNADGTYQMLAFADYVFDIRTAFKGQRFSYRPTDHPDLEQAVFIYDELNARQFKYYKDGMTITYPKPDRTTGTVTVNCLVDFFVYHKDLIKKYNIRPETLKIRKAN